MLVRSFILAVLLAANGPALLPALAPTAAFAQQKQALTLEDIWAKPTFRAATVPGFDWMKDGRYYASLDEGSLVQHEATTGKAAATLVPASALQLPGAAKPLAVDSYSFNADEQKVLFTTDTEPIYRRSSRASYYVFDRGTKKLTALSAGGKQSYATFSPDGRRVAFVRDNNVFLVDLATMKETAVTTTGVRNQLIHGSCDWVYEEEFEFAQAFFLVARFAANCLLHLRRKPGTGVQHAGMGQAVPRGLPLQIPQGGREKLYRAHQQLRCGQRPHY